MGIGFGGGPPPEAIGGVGWCLLRGFEYKVLVVLAELKEVEGEEGGECNEGAG